MVITWALMGDKRTNGYLIVGLMPLINGEAPSVRKREDSWILDFVTLYNIRTNTDGRTLCPESISRSIVLTLLAGDELKMASASIEYSLNHLPTPFLVDLKSRLVKGCDGKAYWLIDGLVNNSCL